MIRLIGANPLLGLFDDGVRTAVASVWRVDWSERGAGRAVVLWYDGSTRVIGPDPELGRWLAQDFTRHFPEVAGVAWPEPEIIEAPVDLDLDLAAGMRATAAGVVVEITGPPLDRRLYRTESFDLGGVAFGLSTVVMPCPAGRLTVDGVAVPGEPEVSTASGVASSTAFLADAEVWWNLT